MVHTDEENLGAKKKLHVDSLKENRELEATWTNFALIALCCVLCPNTSTNLESKYLKYLSSIDVMKKYSWCQFVLDYMIKGINMFNEGNTYLRVNVLMLVVSSL